MFGRMTATILTRLDAGKDLEAAVAELLATTEYPQIARCIQFPTAAVLFLLVPDDPESGAIYVCDRRDGVWISKTKSIPATTSPISTCCLSIPASCGLSKTLACSATRSGLSLQASRRRRWAQAADSLWPWLPPCKSLSATP